MLIPEGGDVMFYGDGGAGKTTLGDRPRLPPRRRRRVARHARPEPVRVRLGRERGAAAAVPGEAAAQARAVGGIQIGDRLQVLESPWATFTFARRDEMAPRSPSASSTSLSWAAHEVGMDEAGTLQEVRDFTALVDRVPGPSRAAL